jgi:hypothetical protein
MKTSALLERTVLKLTFAISKVCAEEGEAEPSGDEKLPIRLLHMKEN